MKKPFLILLVLILSSQGCSPKFSCRENIGGIKCLSISEVYEHEIMGKNLPVQAITPEEAEYEIDNIVDFFDYIFRNDKKEKKKEPVKKLKKRLPDTNITSVSKQNKDREDSRQNMKDKNVGFAGAEDKPESAEILKDIRKPTGIPIRIPPKIIRIWIAPWVDADGDLHEPQRIYSEISPGRWIFGEKELKQPEIKKPQIDKIETKKTEHQNQRSR